MFSRVVLVQRLWIFDFDGTLSPVISDRNAATLLPAAKAMLTELVRLPHQAVAILSSRLLDDLSPRIGIEGIYLGGGSGVEWLLPNGERRTADTKTQRLGNIRATVIPEIEKLSHIQGIDIEDKKWSIAVHVRRVSFEDRTIVLDFLTALRRTTGIRLLRGPEVFEIQLLPEIDKLFGVTVLCGILNFTPDTTDSLVYAGDDENDAVVMEWVIRKGSIAFSVGMDPGIPGVRVLEHPASLIPEIRGLAGLKEQNLNKKGGDHPHESF